MTTADRLSASTRTMLPEHTAAKSMAPASRAMQRVAAGQMALGTDVSWTHRGPAGPPGPPGPPGTSGGSYVHQQPDAATEWRIEHNLGYDPGGVLVHDHDGYIADGWALTYDPPGVAMTLVFQVPCAGTARLS